MLNTLFKKLLPLVALGFGTAVSGCDGMNVQIGESDGVPLAELDMSGEAPTGIVLAGPDTVIVTEGDALAIDVDGDSNVVETLRFSLEDGTLGIMREKNSWSKDGTATVRVTMPLPDEVVIAGSGRAEIPGLASESEVTIAGSGSAVIADIASDRLEVTIAGSGDFEASGTARQMDMTIAGSGTGRMAGLKVDRAEITIAGSGDAEFASDGEVEANIVGSGDVTVNGSARCTIETVGSGTLRCSEGTATANVSAKSADDTEATDPEADAEADAGVE